MPNSGNVSPEALVNILSCHLDHCRWSVFHEMLFSILGKYRCGYLTNASSGKGNKGEMPVQMQTVVDQFYSLGLFSDFGDTRIVNLSYCFVDSKNEPSRFTFPEDNGGNS